MNTGAPAITGNPVDGQTLTTTTGSWIDGPTSYAYQWRACDTLGLVCTDIDNATSSSYVLTSADVGRKLRSVVTASNADGSAAATSTQTPVVSVPPPPTNTALPKISGTPSFGNTLTASIGSWTNSPTSYAYQWQDCSGGRCPGIPGATSSSYTLQSSYAGDTIDVVVTATNAGGSSPATSAQTAAVTGSSSGCPSSTPNTPDGADPWGSCFPGPQTSGVPGNVTLVNVSSGIQPPNAALPSDNTGWTNSGGTIRLTSATAVVDGISTSGGLNVLSGSGGLVKDSSFANHVNFSSTSSLTIENTTVYGGSNTNWDGIDNFDKGALVANGDNISGGGHGILCYSNCTIENTYIDNLAPGDGAHQNPILLDGGSNDTVAHNTVHCVTGNDCTSELTLEEDDGDQVNETVTQNLLMAAGDQAAYCAYPGPFRSVAKYQVSGITWEDNVIQKGANGHCDSSYGEVYGWDPSTCSPNPCTWTGNVYDDGTVWNP